MMKIQKRVSYKGIYDLHSKINQIEEEMIIENVRTFHQKTSMTELEKHLETILENIQTKERNFSFEDEFELKSKEVDA